jgi:succinylglutamic semialdehyde dehydrogenase
VESPRERLLRRGNYIWGSWVKPERVDGTLAGVNPGDRSDDLGRFPFSVSAADDAVGAARLGATAWETVELAERAKAVRRFGDVLGKQHERLAMLLTRETGKPLWEARQEVVASLRAVDLLLEEGLPLFEPRVLHETDARSDARPRGVVAIVAPYPFPLLGPTVQVCAALLAGNAVVLKPSKFTPAVGQAIGEIADRCRLPRGVFNLVQGTGTTVGRSLVAHPDLDALVFAGSWDAAKAIRAATAERPELPALLHCGGKAAAIVLGGDLDRAVYEVLVGAFLTAGQRPTSTARVLVIDAVADAFTEAIARRAARLRIGYGFDPDTFCGPLISDAIRARHLRYGRALAQRGHRELVPFAPREVSHRQGFYADPAVVEVDWRSGHPFLNDEPPGPVLLLYRVSSAEEAAALHDRLLFRSITGVFAAPDDPALAGMSAALHTGCLHLNRNTVGGSLRLPTVPLGRASNGVPAGIELLRFLSTQRATLAEGRPFDASQALPGTRWDDTIDDEDDDVPLLEIEGIPAES